jgi:hypothetical protein
LTLLACLLPKLLKTVSAIVKKKTRFDGVHVCIEEKAIVERSPEYRLSEVGRSVGRGNGGEKKRMQTVLGAGNPGNLRPFPLLPPPGTINNIRHSSSPTTKKQRNNTRFPSFLPSFSHTFFCFRDQPEEAPALE